MQTLKLMIKNREETPISFEQIQKVAVPLPTRKPEKSKAWKELPFRDAVAELVCDFEVSFQKSVIQKSRLQYAN